MYNCAYQIRQKQATFASVKLPQILHKYGVNNSLLSNYYRRDLIWLNVYF